MPLERTKEVDARLETASTRSSRLTTDVDLEGAGVIGIARIDLEPLSRVFPLQGAFRSSRSRARRREPST